MIWLANGERALVQWSRGNVVLLTTRGDEVRASREDDRVARVITVTKTGNLFRAEIPDRMMTESGYIRISVINRADDGESIVDHARFTIRPAQRPNDYVHGAGETADWKVLRAQMDAILRDVREGKFKGLPGKDGATPYIGENKHWYIAGVDTGIRAEGLDYILTPDDREEVANTITERFRNTFAGLYTSGIISGGDDDAMKAYVPEGEQYRIRIPAGTVLIEGVARYFNTHTRTLLLSPGETRREVGLWRLDVENGTVSPVWRRVEIREGRYWSEDDGYLPVRDDTYYDLLNCYIEIPAGAAAITDDMIVDLRQNPELCGFVESTVPYSLRGTTADITPADVYDAVLDGRVVVLTHEDGDAGILVFNGFVFEEARQEISASAVIEVGGVNRMYKLFGAIDGTVWSSMLADMGSGGGTGGGGVTQITSDMVTGALGYIPVTPQQLEATNETAAAAQKTAGEAKTLAGNAQPKGDYALRSDIPDVPVQSVNGKTGAVQLTAETVGAESSGAVSAHNTSDASHSDIRLLISGLTTRLNALANSTDTDLDQLAEIVAYIKANKTLIDSITTSKVNVSDIIDNLTTSVSNKPLSAKQGVALKALIDAIEIPTTLPASDVYAWAKASTKPSYSKSEVGLGNVDNVKQYSASNPPPYPVKSVNGKTGAVVLTAADVGAATTEQVAALRSYVDTEILGGEW